MSRPNSPRLTAGIAGTIIPFPRPFPSDSAFYPIVVTVAGQGRKGFVDGHRLEQAYFCGPLDACHLPDFSVILSDGRNNALRRLDLQSNAVTTLTTHAFLGPRSPVVIDGGAAVVICDSGHNKVRMVQVAPDDPCRVLQDCTIAGTGRHGHIDGPANTAAFARPVGLCVIHDGSILVADSQNHAIRRIAGRPGRQGLFVTTIIGGNSGGRPGCIDGDEATARLNCPTALAVDAHGTVLVVDAGNTALRALHLPPGRDASSTRGWALTTICGDGSTGFSDGTAADSALLREPVSLAIGGDGELLFSDAGNHAVRALLPLPSGAALPHGGGLFRVNQQSGAAASGASNSGSTNARTSPSRSAPPGPAPSPPDDGRPSLIGVVRVGDLSHRTAGPAAHWVVVGPQGALGAAQAGQGVALRSIFDAAAAEDRARRKAGGGGGESPGGTGIASHAWMRTSLVGSPSPEIPDATPIRGNASFANGAAVSVAGSASGYEHASRLAQRAAPVHYVPYHDPAAVLAVHERYARLITIAGAPPSAAASDAGEPQQSASPASAVGTKGYADGHSTQHARLQRPHGLCVLSGGVGSPVLVLDAGNDMVRLLVSKNAMDLQPVILRQVIPQDAVALARRIIIERRAELIAAMPRDAALSPQALASSLRRLGWVEQQRSPRGGGIDRVPSAAHSVGTMGSSGAAQLRSSSSATAPTASQAQQQQQQQQSQNRQPSQSQRVSGPQQATASITLSARLLAHTESSLRRFGPRTHTTASESTATPPPDALVAAAAPAPWSAAVPAAASSASAPDQGRALAAGASGASVQRSSDARMTLEEIASAAEIDDGLDQPMNASAAVPPAPPPAPPVVPGVTLTRADAQPVPHVLRPLPPATALSPALAPAGRGAWQSVPFAASSGDKLQQAPSALIRGPLGASHDPVGAGLIAASVISARQPQKRVDLSSRPAPFGSGASTSSALAHVGGRAPRPHPSDPYPAPDERALRAAAHPQLPAHLRALGDGEIFRVAAELVDASAAAHSDSEAHYARPTSAQRQRVAATPLAARNAVAYPEYPGTTGPSTLSGGEARRRGASAERGLVRLRATEAGGSALARPGDASTAGLGGAPLSHDTLLLAGTHNPAFWAHHELCPDRGRLAGHERLGSRDAIAHEDADATGAVVQALLLSESVGEGAGGGRRASAVLHRRASVSSASSGLLSARFTRHTASSASNLRARGHKAVRAAPAFVNVSAVVARKLIDLRERSSAAAAAQAARRRGPRYPQQQHTSPPEAGYSVGRSAGRLGGAAEEEDNGAEDDHSTLAPRSQAQSHSSAAVSLGPAPGTADHELYTGVSAALSPAVADIMAVAVQRNSRLEGAQMRRGAGESSPAARVRPSSAAAAARRRPGGGGGVQTDTSGGGDLSLLAVRSFHPAFAASTPALF